MRKFLSNIFGFFIFFCLFYIVAIAALGKILPPDLRPNLKYYAQDYGSTYSMLSDLRKVDSVDILVLGASDAYRGYDPRIFESYGYKLFNLGSSSQTPVQTEILLKKYLNQLKPKIVIYEVSPVCFTLDGIESSMDFILNKVDKNIALKLLLETPDIMLINSFIYSSVADIFYSQEDEKNIFYTEKETYIKNGYVETKLMFNKKNKIDSLKWVPFTWQINGFEQVCKILRENKIKYFLVNANNITDKGFFNIKETNNLFNSNGTFIDMGATLSLDDSLHFFDNSHLNQNGVREFNRYFIDSVLKGNRSSHYK